MFYEDIKEMGQISFFYYMGQDGIGLVVIWGKLESDKLGWDKLTWGKMTCNLYIMLKLSYCFSPIRENWINM